MISFLLVVISISKWQAEDYNTKSIESIEATHGAKVSIVKRFHLDANKSPLSVVFHRRAAKLY